MVVFVLDPAADLEAGRRIGLTSRRHGRRCLPPTGRHRWWRTGGRRFTRARRFVGCAGDEMQGRCTRTRRLAGANLGRVAETGSSFLQTHWSAHYEYGFNCNEMNQHLPTEVHLAGPWIVVAGPVLHTREVQNVSFGRRAHRRKRRELPSR